MSAFHLLCNLASIWSDWVFVIEIHPFVRTVNIRWSRQQWGSRFHIDILRTLLPSTCHTTSPQAIGTVRQIPYWCGLTPWSGFFLIAVPERLVQPVRRRAPPHRSGINSPLSPRVPIVAAGRVPPWNDPQYVRRKGCRNADAFRCHFKPFPPADLPKAREDPGRSCRGWPSGLLGDTPSLGRLTSPG